MHLSSEAEQKNCSSGVAVLPSMFCTTCCWLQPTRHGPGLLQLARFFVYPPVSSTRSTLWCRLLATLQRGLPEALQAASPRSATRRNYYSSGTGDSSITRLCDIRPQALFCAIPNPGFLRTIVSYPLSSCSLRATIVLVSRPTCTVRMSLENILSTSSIIPALQPDTVL